MGAASLTAPTSGKMHVDAVGGFGGWSVGCAIKRGGRWDRAKVQQAAEHYDDDGHGKDIGSRLLMLAAVTAARALPPHTKICRVTQKRARGENTRRFAPCTARWIRSSIEVSAY